MSKLINRVRRFVRKDEEGASLIEYGLLVALIALVCIAAITTTGTQVRAVFTAIAAALQAAL